MTTVLICAHGNHAQAPEVLETPGALAILVDSDGNARHLVGRASKRDSARSGLSGQSEASDNEHCEQYDSYGGAASDCNYSDSDPRRDSTASSHSRKTRSVAGQAGKVIKDGFKGIGKAGRMLGRTVAKAPGLSLLPSAAPSSSTPAPAAH
jgi:hypothetical protein